ncbi:MAG: alpha/beta hydrolase [Pseudomonadota bacterium]
MARITRSIYDEDLRPAYLGGRIVIWIARRKWGLLLMQRFAMLPLKGSQVDGVINEEILIPSSSTPGHKIRVRIYKPAKATEPLPAMLYAHGGGYQVGLPELASDFYRDIMGKRDVVIVAPAYRLSLDGHPYPAGHDDCYDTLLYMKNNASDLGIRSDRFIVAGHSGGGGMAAAVTMKAVDTKEVDIAFQMPVYPMLDHRMQTQSAREMVGAPVWDQRSNALAWNNYLGHWEGDVPDYASPALRKDLSGHPPTISFVGDLEPFKDETINYINALEAAGIPTAFKLYEGGFHAFEILRPQAPISKAANAFQINAFAEFYDKYL